VIAEAAQSMRSICDTLLNNAREKTHNASAAPGTATVAPVLHRLTTNLSTREQIRTVVDVPDAELEAGVAPALLERIVGPLLTNALRYARSAVTVSARARPGGLRITVTDDGPGVPGEFLDDLFQPGRRADPGDGHDGAGLGLPLARRLARTVGGDVCHDPGHEPGARFLVDLPAG
jgi:two-component system heavy metal sensor histidine kinase CusS